MSNSTSFSDEASVSSGVRLPDLSSSSLISPLFSHQPQKPKRKRGLPGNPDPDAEVIALSPKTLMTTNRFVCEVCNKGFQRDQNLQLHRRGHNLPWKLKQRNNNEVRKRVYVCPEPSCVHHHPSRALGDLTGIKKHFCRKHGEKLWKCDKCSKRYAVQSDWKAHAKTCGTREYRCDCGTLFSRKDSFVTHRAFCDALAEESARIIASASLPSALHTSRYSPPPSPSTPALVDPRSWAQQPLSSVHMTQLWLPPLPLPPPPPPLPAMSATALLQQAAAAAGPLSASFDGLDLSWCRGADKEGMTRDFLGVKAAQPAASPGMAVPRLLTFTTTTSPASAATTGTGLGVGPGRFGYSYDTVVPIMKQPISAFGTHYNAWSEY